MNVTWIKKLGLSALGCALASGTFAMAGSFAVTVDFSCADGSGTGSAGATCNPGNPLGAVPLSMWTQGFTGSSGAGAVKVAGVSTSSFGFSLDSDYGDPAAPSVGGPAGKQNLTVTDAGDYLFSFTGLDLGAWSNNNVSYTITGWNQGTEEFTETANIQPCAGTAQTCGNTYNWEWIAGNSDWLTELTITTNSNSGVLVDSLEENVTPAPEPGSLFLLGTGLLGLAFVAFRKSRTANLSL